MTSYTSEKIDPVKWFRLFEAGKISRAAFLECLSVQREAAKEYLSVREIDRISTAAPQPTLSLKVTRKKGVEILLVDAVRSISQAITEP